MKHPSVEHLYGEHCIQTATRIRDFFETLHPAMRYEEYLALYDEAVYFKDPFHEVQSLHAMMGVFTQMFKNLDAPRFKLLECVQQGDVAYVQWQFIFHYKGEARKRRFTGVSRLLLNRDKKVVEHIDYWDAAQHIYESFPIIGSLLRFIKRKIAKKHANALRASPANAHERMDA